MKKKKYTDRKQQSEKFVVLVGIKSQTPERSF